MSADETPQISARRGRKPRPAPADDLPGQPRAMREPLTAADPAEEALSEIAVAGDEPAAGEQPDGHDELDDALLGELDGMHAEDDLAAPSDQQPDDDEADEPADTAAAPFEEAEPAPPPAARRSASGWYLLNDDGIVRGWCVDRNRAEQRLTVAISIDGLVVGEALADRPHQRLLADGLGDGRYAFAFAVPLDYHDGEAHELEAAITTPGYEGIRLKIKQPVFSIPAEVAKRFVSLRLATTDGVEGVIAGAHARQELDVWQGGRRLGEDEVSVDWSWPGGDGVPFRIRFPRHPLARLLTDGFRIAYPGVGEAWSGGARPADLLTVEVNPLGGGDYEVVVGPGVWLADEAAVQATIYADQPGRAALATRELRFRDNAAVLTLEEREGQDRMLLRLAIDGQPLGPDIPFIFASLSRRMLPNGAFEQWDAAGPEGFVVPENVVVERGFYAFPPEIKNQFLLSGKLAAAALEGAGERVLLRKSLARTGSLGAEPVRIGTGFFARASRPAAFGLHLVDRTGARHTLYAGVVGAKWKSDWRTVDFHRSAAELTELSFEVTARSLGDEEGGANFVELAGLHCGEPDVTTFADMLEPPARREHFGQGENLVVNADLTSWPGGLAFGDRRSRFEVAEGWNIFNRRATAEIRVAALPSPAGTHGRYALALAIPSVPEYCRLEVALDCQDLGGQGRLRFDARCGDLPAIDGQAYSPAQWSFIDRVYLLKRDTREEGDRLVTRDMVVAGIAKRVVVTSQWEESRFDFTAGGTGEDEFDLARDDGAYVEYLLVFEFRQPIALSLHGVSVRFGGRPPAPQDGPLMMEDRNIRAQLGATRGIEAWNLPAVVRPAVFPLGDESAAGPIRWSWKHAGAGTVEVGICVYNAADETLACLRSLVGASGVPHTVRIINDGSDEDTRQRIAAFVADKPWMTLVDNDGNRGYTHSANRAVTESDADWVILLNSDTIVSRGWIEGLLEAAASDPRTAFVGAVSNAATYQSVPELYDGAGKWAVNRLPEGHAPADLAAFVAHRSGRHFPEVPLLNGFCTLIRRAVFAEVGGLNEQAFPAGYGEENDLCLRVRKAGYRLRVADHVYIYHSKSASFGSARRTELAKAGDKTLRAIHQDVDLGALGRDFLETPALVELRATVRAAYAPTELAYAGGPG